jgi:hypothetical protein
MLIPFSGDGTTKTRLTPTRVVFEDVNLKEWDMSNAVIACGGRHMTFLMKGEM